MVEHPVILRGVSPNGAIAGPVILERTDQEFIDGILDELTTEGAIGIAKSQAKTVNQDGSLKLFQPVHRTFEVALLEVVCDTLGQPRLDPDQIDSAGLVLRRRAVNSEGLVLPDQWEGWRQGVAVDAQGQVLPDQLAKGKQSGHTVRGWVSFHSLPDSDGDPDPKRRRAELTAGHPEIDRRLLLSLPPTEKFSESVSPLFVAPPEVCQAARLTILYGLVPVTSSEASEVPSRGPTYTDEDLRSHLPYYLKAGGSRQLPGASANRRLTYLNAGDGDLSAFVLTLRQLYYELGAFSTMPTGIALFNALNSLDVDADTTSARPLGDFLKQATNVLIDPQGRQGNPLPTVTMPSTWPVIDANQENTLVGLLRAILESRLSELTSGEGRFDDLERQYQIRAFVRVKRTDGCPDRLVWSEYSQPFTIAPWYDGNNAVPPLRVALPNAMDRDFLSKLKPNVAFIVPKDLFNFLQGANLKDLMDGKKPQQGNGLVLDWICSFNIPIITFCAFIVLNIFLQLFDLFFQWLLFIKICIPFPRRK
jgi:hypothetical protein